MGLGQARGGEGTLAEAGAPCFGLPPPPPSVPTATQQSLTADGARAPVIWDPRLRSFSVCRNPASSKALLPSSDHHLFSEFGFFSKSKESCCLQIAFVLASALPKFPKLNWETQSWATLQGVGAGRGQNTRNKTEIDTDLAYHAHTARALDLGVRGTGKQQDL